MTEIYFGDRKSFGIRYSRGYKFISNNHTWVYCNLHLILGGHIIADKFGDSVAGVWIGGLERMQTMISKSSNYLEHAEFKNRSDEELFELVWKSNQRESDFNPHFKYLPQLDNSVWSNCSVHLDDSTDQYLIATIGIGDKIKFIWKGLQGPCPVDEIGKLFAVTVDREFVETTISDCIDYVENDYKNCVCC